MYAGEASDKRSLDYALSAYPNNLAVLSVQLLSFS
ncbi:hypothetical protein Krac_3515 [Ktedonobacter racemifer DSM 44963]|uniref:Uncharacterized protein n=1 Tax=Ktedonobacter racemifer DSM 44963 TaxID=485913 RepID=D6U1N4_KTERA|nr:hypothetical protein Krac_3515 [Ktedonobacter racemifer DSM 44963]